MRSLFFSTSFTKLLQVAIGTNTQGFVLRYENRHYYTPGILRLHGRVWVDLAKKVRQGVRPSKPHFFYFCQSLKYRNTKSCSLRSSKSQSHTEDIVKNLNTTLVILYFQSGSLGEKCKIRFFIKVYVVVWTLGETNPLAASSLSSPLRSLLEIYHKHVHILCRSL
jgi:hypothetical protein